MAKYKFKLMLGQHVGDDMTQKKDEKTGRYPERTFQPGDVVESDTDLVAKLGGDKFQLLEGGGEHRATSNQTKAPHGQVSAGFQVAEGAQLGTELKRTELSVEDAEEAKEAWEGKSAAKATPIVDNEAGAAGSPEAQHDAATQGGQESAEQREEKQAREEKQSGEEKQKAEKQQKGEKAPAAEEEEAPTEQELRNLSVADLKALAAEEEIDLGTASNKESIIRAIRSHYKQ